MLVVCCPAPVHGPGMLLSYLYYWHMLCLWCGLGYAKVGPGHMGCDYAAAHLGPTWQG